MIVRLAAHAMATRFEIVLDGGDEARLRAIGEEALATIEEAEARLSRFDAGSLLSHVNRRAGQQPVRVDDELLELLAECRQVTADSGGAFDVTVAPLMSRWGLRGADHAGAAGVVGMVDVELDTAARTVRFRRPGIALDLGGIGKGHGLDLAAEVISEHGLRRALLHGGTSSVVAIGAPPDQPGWRVAVRGTPGTTAVLRDVALSVSAPSGGRVRDAGGHPVGHVMDPRRGTPATGVRVAAVIAPTARLADAWSTALVVLGRRPDSMPEAMTALIMHDGADRPVVSGGRPELFEPGTAGADGARSAMTADRDARPLLGASR